MIWVLLLMLGRDVLLHDGRAVLGEDEESIDDAEQKRREGSSNSKEGGGLKCAREEWGTERRQS
jgi:hypothetical protein